MPPRYAYWTILIDNNATAFRAREREELLPTFHQLKRKNADVVMKWYARGRLWESPIEAQAALRAPRPPAEKRGAGWRPGGEHRDSRDRFKKRAQPHSARPAGPSGHQKPATGRQPKPWSDKPHAGQLSRDRPGVAKRASSWRDRIQPASRPTWRTEPGPSGPRGSATGTKRGGPAGKTPWPRDRPARNNQQKPWKGVRPEAEAPPRRHDESSTTPPLPEEIVVKPKPPERG
jgi:hypothetical protein